jgi:Domain of unknown function (DUF4129)
MERVLKATGLGAGMLGLVLLVAMGAREGHPGTSGHVASRAVPNTVQDSFVTLLAILYILAIVAIVVGLFRYKDRWHDPQSSWLKNFALVLLLMGIATAVGYFAISHSGLRKQAAKVQRAQSTSGSTQNRPRHVPATTARQAHFEWPVAAGLGGLLLLGGIWFYVRSRRRLAPLLEQPGLEADMVSAIETTIEDLRSEQDPRRAVIAAYALMERTLARHGFARHRSEAPLEYLATILRGLRVRESAVRTLTTLFQYAKFSRHEISPAMKEEAIDALLAIRDDLRPEKAQAA